MRLKSYTSENNVPTFYAWWLKEVFVPFVDQIRILHGDPPGSKAVLVEDGESVQIQNLLMDSDSRKFLSDNHIMIGKSSASTTEIEQPLDRGNLFKCFDNFSSEKSINACYMTYYF